MNLEARCTREVNKLRKRIDKYPEGEKKRVLLENWSVLAKLMEKRVEGKKKEAT